MNALETAGVGFRIGGATILDDVSLGVRTGELLGVIGPNGAGKTTLLNLLTGVIRPTSGRITLEGRDVTAVPAYQRVRAGLGRTFQTSSVFPTLDVFENVRLAAEAARGGALRLWRRARSVTQAATTAREALATVGLADRADVTAGSLAHGERRKLELAILLAQQPRVLLLDEPMAGVSAGDVDGLVEVIGAVHATGRTVVMVEHHMDVVLGLAQRVAVLHHGTLLTCSEPAQVMADPQVQEAYLGEPL